MGYKSRRVGVVGVSLILVPAVFFTICIGCGKLNDILGSREVSRYIGEHQSIIAERLLNPKVHLLALGHDPDHSATLVIQFDVDDKETYLLLEEDLIDSRELRFPAVWNTILRSKEDLGNNFGNAPLLDLEDLLRFGVIVVASVTVGGAYLYLYLGPEPIESMET